MKQASVDVKEVQLTGEEMMQQSQSSTDSGRRNSGVQVVCKTPIFFLKQTQAVARIAALWSPHIPPLD